MPTRGRVLVIEENLDILEALADALTQEGFSVKCARGIVPALPLLARERPDILILDGSAGLTWQTALALRFLQLETVPVVLLTTAERQIPASLQVAARLAKPFGVDELLSAIGPALRM